MTEKTDLPALIARVGPRETVNRSCYDCSVCKSESYAVQGDSGHDVYCTHPLVGRKHIADTSWATPDWCPALPPAAPLLAAECERLQAEVLLERAARLSAEVERDGLKLDAESMAMRIESLAEELAKPEDVRLREALDALDGRAVIFDGLGARVGHLLDEMDEWIERAGAAERRLKKAEEVVLMARQLTAYAWEDRLEDCEVSDSAKHDSRELSTAVWLYDQEAKS